MRRNIYKIFFGVVFSGTLLFTSGCSGTDNAGSNNTRIGISASDSSALSTSADETYLMVGKIDSNDQASLSSKISARVMDVLKDVGDNVNQGEPIIILDSRDVEAGIRQAEAAVGVAQANLNKILTGARTEQIAQATATLESATKNYQVTKENVEKARESYSQLLISKTERDAAESLFASSEAQYKSAQQALNQLKSGETKETISMYQAQLNQANAAYEFSKVQLSNTTITSPVSGKVSSRAIQKGEMAMAGQVLLSIVNSNSLILNSYVPSEIAEKLKQGQSVVIKIAELGDKKFSGEVVMIDSVIDSKNRNVFVKISVKDTGNLLKPGMVAQIGIKEGV